MKFDTKVKVNGQFYEAGEEIEEEVVEEKPKTKRK